MKRSWRRRLAASFVCAMAVVAQNAEAFAFTTTAPNCGRVCSNPHSSLCHLFGRRVPPCDSISRTRTHSTVLLAMMTKSRRPPTSKEQTLLASSPQQQQQQQEELIPATMTDALNRFFFGPDRGPICVLGMLSFLFAWRCTLTAGVTILDPIVAGAMVLFWCVQEHVIHDKLLHSKGNWMGKAIHENHHAKPYFNISIDPAWLMVSWLTTAHVLLRLILPLPLALSATLGYACAGLTYEWAHYIVHTRVKPPNAFWKRVRDNHVRHHLIDDRYWLSFTLPIVDNVFGTNPSVDEVRREQTRLRNESGSNTESSTSDPSVVVVATTAEGVVE